MSLLSPKKGIMLEMCDIHDNQRERVLVRTYSFTWHKSYFIIYTLVKSNTGSGQGASNCQLVDIISESVSRCIFFFFYIFT